MAERWPNSDASNSVVSHLDDMRSASCHDHHERLSQLESTHPTSKDASLANASPSPPRIRTLNFAKKDGAKVKKPPKKAMANPSISKVSSNVSVSDKPMAPPPQHLANRSVARQKPAEKTTNESARANGRPAENVKSQNSVPLVPPPEVPKGGGDFSVKREDDDENNIPKLGGYLTLPSNIARDSIPSPLDSFVRIAASPMPATPRRTRVVPPRRLPLNSGLLSPRRPPGDGPGQRNVSGMTTTSDAIHVKEEDEASDFQAVERLPRNFHLPGLALTLADEMSIAQDPREPEDILDIFEYAGVGTK